MTIDVLLADDQDLVRAGLEMIVDATDDLRVAGHASDGAEAVERARSLRPDVVLMDVRMPGVDGIEATRRLIAMRPDIKVLILTTFNHDEYVWAALRAGASGFLLKRASPERLIDGVRVVAAGEALLDPAVTRSLIQRHIGAGPSGHHATEAQSTLDQLTQRERQVLALVGQGRSNQEIADLLVIAESTAKTHVKRILAKIGARDRAQAVVFAYQSGLIDAGSH